eukprot:355788_1
MSFKKLVRLPMICTFLLLVNSDDAYHLTTTELVEDAANKISQSPIQLAKTFVNHNIFYIIIAALCLSICCCVCVLHYMVSHHCKKKKEQVLADAVDKDKQVPPPPPRDNQYSVEIVYKDADSDVEGTQSIPSSNGQIITARPLFFEFHQDPIVPPVPSPSRPRSHTSPTRSIQPPPLNGSLPAVRFPMSHHHFPNPNMFYPSHAHAHHHGYGPYAVPTYPQSAQPNQPMPGTYGGQHVQSQPYQPAIGGCASSGRPRANTEPHPQGHHVRTSWGERRFVPPPPVRSLPPPPAQPPVQQRRKQMQIVISSVNHVKADTGQLTGITDVTDRTDLTMCTTYYSDDETPTPSTGTTVLTPDTIHSPKERRKRKQPSFTPIMPNQLSPDMDSLSLGTTTDTTHTNVKELNLDLMRVSSSPVDTPVQVPEIATPNAISPMDDTYIDNGRMHRPFPSTTAKHVVV